MRCVIFGIEARVEDDVVAGMLAFGAQPPAKKPEQRIEPVCGSCQFSNDLYEPVEAFDVCYFMRKDNAETVISPGIHIMWKQNDRTDNTPGSKACSSILKQAYSSLDAKAWPDFVNNF